VRSHCLDQAAIRCGLRFALDYLVTEKLFSFAEIAASRTEFSREVLGFVADVRRIFTKPELTGYLKMLERNRIEQTTEEFFEAVEFTDVCILETAQQKRFATVQVTLLACVFRSNAATDSGGSRPPDSGEASHPLGGCAAGSFPQGKDVSQRQKRRDRSSGRSWVLTRLVACFIHNVG
jgi:hypothetical protein